MWRLYTNKHQEYPKCESKLFGHYVHTSWAAMLVSDSVQELAWMKSIWKIIFKLQYTVALLINITRKYVNISLELEIYE